MFFLWAGFILFILLMLAIDLGLFGKKSGEVSSKSAMRWVVVSVATALAFNVLIYFMYENHWLGLGTHADAVANGSQAAMQFFTGWIVEQSLSLDNVFVIAVIFGYFGIPLMYQHRVLFWGIVGALLMRGIVIAIGTALVRNLEWINYVFGALLVFTAYKMWQSGDEAPNLKNNLMVRIARRFYPVSSEFDGEKFFTVVNAKRAMTPLFLALLVVETTDVVFAVDSIPAVFAITQDPFIVFTSNVFAILNLRSLYFTLALVLKKFHYVKASLVFVLLFVGLKMLLEHFVPISTGMSLAVIAILLGGGFLLSIAVKENPSKGH